MPDITVSAKDIQPIESTFEAVALEDIKYGDYVARQWITTGDVIEVSLWRDSLGLPPDGMAMSNATKGEIVQCVSRGIIYSGKAPDKPYYLK